MPDRTIPPASNPKPATVTGKARPAATSTRLLLLCGVIAGPLFLAVSYAQALTHDGFDLTRNAFSFLSLGDLGWIQIINFVVSGLLFVIGATGIRRALPAGRGSTWAPRLIGAMGVAMIAGGMFVVDPAFGFPPGAPNGKGPLSWHGNLHGVAFSVAVLSWMASCFVFARRFAGTKQRGWATYSMAIGLALLAPIETIFAPPGAILIYVAATLGWTWTSAVMARLLTELPSGPALTHSASRQGSR